MKLTPKAVEKLKSLREDPGQALRVSVIGGGCSGMSYNMKWITLGETTVFDNVELFDTISVVVDPKSGLFLKGVELDYSDDLNDSGFKWNNPNAKRTCGCGSSFSN